VPDSYKKGLGVSVPVPAPKKGPAEEGVEALRSDPGLKPAKEWPLPPAQGFGVSLERRRLHFYIVMVLLDIAIVLASFWISGAAYVRTRVYYDALLPAYLLLPVYLTIAFYNSTYSRESIADFRYASKKALAALVLSAMLLNFLAFFAKYNAEFSRVAFTSGLILAGLLIALSRRLVARTAKSYWGERSVNRLIIEAGGPPVTIPYAFVVDAGGQGLLPDIDDPHALDRLAQYVRNMDEVIVSCNEGQRKAWADTLKAAGVHGELVSDLAHEVGAIGIVNRDDAGVTSLLVSSGQLRLRSRVTKRAFDLAFSGLALIFAAPVMLLIAVIIRLEDGGTVFFKQRRMGRGNGFFEIYKFRTMRDAASDADGAVSTEREDKRVTWIGRFLRRTSLDELPQLYNVLRGDMSMVGPRPHALGSLAGDKVFWQVDRKYWERHSLRPGITGLAQVRGLRGATDTEGDLSARLQADFEYLNQWSLWGDIKIILATLRVLVHHRAY
jgi:exopolysaccharide biosynthesis polyprenyl glycosylphosphotransferase